MVSLTQRDLQQLLTAMENRGDHRNSDQRYVGLYIKLHRAAVRMTAPPCDATIHHGPGHQSRTHCRVRQQPHDWHEAVYGSDSTFATWRGKDAFTGAFDEPPSEDEPNYDVTTEDLIGPEDMPLH